MFPSTLLLAPIILLSLTSALKVSSSPEPQQSLQKPFSLPANRHAQGIPSSTWDWEIEDLAVGAENEVGTYEGWSVWRFELGGGEGEKEKKVKERVLRVVEVSFSL